MDESGVLDNNNYKLLTIPKSQYSNTSTNNNTDTCSTIPKLATILTPVTLPLPLLRPFGMYLRFGAEGSGNTQRRQPYLGCSRGLKMVLFVSF